MAEIINLVEHRATFPFMVIPVFHRVADGGSAGLLMNNGVPLHKLDQLTGIDETNISWKTNESLYVGPSSFYSQEVGYNKIVGLDPIDLFISTDTYSDFDYTYITENGFISTPGFLKTIPPMELNRNSDGSAILDEAFNIGNELVKQYHFRKGNNVSGYGLRNFAGPAHIGAVILKPNKGRDLSPMIIKTFFAPTKDELNLQMLEFQLSIDPDSSRFSQKYTSTHEIKDERVIFGFLLASPHLTMFSYKASSFIAGVSNHDDEKYKE